MSETLKYIGKPNINMIIDWRKIIDRTGGDTVNRDRLRFSDDEDRHKALNALVEHMIHLASASDLVGNDEDYFRSQHEREALVIDSIYPESKDATGLIASIISYIDIKVCP